MPELAKKFLIAARASPEREPPLFPWQGQIVFADQIIARVGAPTRNRSGIGRRPSPPSDIQHYREGIAKLLAELQEIYITALGDYELRNDPKRPERKLRKKDMWHVDLPGLDYGEDAGAGLGDWEAFYDEVYARSRGNPGSNRGGGPPIAPLRPIYCSVQSWWRGHKLGKFHPTFDGDEEAYFNAPSRFLLGIVQTLDPAFTVENLRGLYETRRKSE